MTKAAKIGLSASVVVLGLAVIRLTYAQLPPEVDPTGAAYLRVNINPTNVPPMVNINPYQTAPGVRVTELPEIKIPPTGCQNRRSYQTGIGRSIGGPIMITYLHLPTESRVTLTDASGSHSMNLGSPGSVSTAIFLQPNQRMDFDTDVMYSGCRPD